MRGRSSYARTVALILATVALALGAVQASPAPVTAAQVGPPPGIHLRGSASCDSAIDYSPTPTFSNVLFDRVALWPSTFVWQMGYDRHRYARPFHYFGKQGVEVKAGSSPVDLIVPVAWRNRASLVYGDSGGREGSSMVRIKGCSAPEPSTPWLAYPGGFYVRKPLCLPLRVRVGTRSTVIRVSLGRACPSG
jgi:hypothetical protein